MIHSALARLFSDERLRRRPEIATCCGSGASTELRSGARDRKRSPDTIVKVPPRIPYITSIQVSDPKWPFANDR